jgi:hypothetical protein
MDSLFTCKHSGFFDALWLVGEMEGQAHKLANAEWDRTLRSIIALRTLAEGPNLEDATLKEY